MDVAVANTANDRVSVLLGDGAGGFPQRAAYVAGQRVRGVAALDLDGDGVDDLVTATAVYSLIPEFLAGRQA